MHRARPPLHLLAVAGSLVALVGAGCFDSRSGSAGGDTAAAIDGESDADTSASPDDTADAADTVVPPADTHVDAGDTALPGDTSGPCTGHDDCGCTGGVCLSTGSCWCPPCGDDDDCGPGLDCLFGSCVVHDPACDPPLRITPQSGPETGGTLVVATGGRFHVGALEWLMRIGDGPVARPLYGDGFASACSLGFLTPPMAPGTYPVTVFYGYAGEDPVPDGAAGSFTYTPHAGGVGRAVGCRSDGQCAPREACDVGSGRCVPALCASLVCPGPCDDLEGCLDGDAGCQDDSDCRLISSSCACDAVASSDPRTALADCRFDDCASCADNRCEREHVRAVCLAGACTERRGDPSGLACADLVAEPVTDRVVSAGPVRELRAALASGGSVHDLVLVWLEPVGSPSYRYGVLRAVGLDGELAARDAIATLDAPGGLDSHPAVAADAAGFGVAWVTEPSGGPALAFQRLTRDGAPSGPLMAVPGAPDVFINPALIATATGFDAFWMERQGDQDGLHHRRLDAAGAVLGEASWLPWLRTDLSAPAVVSGLAGAGAAIVWESADYSFGGLWLSDFPPSGAPLLQLSERGRAPTAAVTYPGHGFTAVWREEISVPTQIGVTLQAFDQAGRPLSAPLEAARSQRPVNAAHAASLGGVTLAVWLEADPPAQTWELRARPVTEDGRVLGPPRTVASGLGPVFPDPVTLRRGDELVTAWVEAGAAPGDDAIAFVRWTCMPPR